MEEVSQQRIQPDTQPALPVNDIREDTSAAPSVRKDAALEDISITFNKQEGFGYIGQDKDIQTLDVQKAISDMKKDQVLQQYQYFVGSARNLMAQSADGTVITKF